MTTTIRNSSERLGILSVLAAVILVLSGAVQAMPMRPELRAQIASSPTAEKAYQRQLQSLRERGIDQPDDVLQNMLAKPGISLSPQVPVQFRMLVLLVDFPDKAHQVNASFFDNIIFDSSGNSIRSYYGEISYTRFDIVTLNQPSSTGWFTAAHDYAYYVDGQGGMGTYPNNAQALVEEVVDAADPYVDYSNYDNDGNGRVDAVVVVHAGSGREYTGSNDDIHSHKWGINTRYHDGVGISTYTIQPEYWSAANDLTIGVFCHELGHVFGLPDLYDTDNSSFGVGAWCLMAYGSWNGTNGASPSHPSAWCLDKLGFANRVNVAGNITGQSIDAVEQGGSIYRLWSGGDSTSQEYFLVENRQKTGYDSFLPSSGLLIWHVDEAKWGSSDNDAEWIPGQSPSNHYLVALVQADSLYQIEKKLNLGNGGDPYPGSTNNSTFNVTSNPSSDSYLGGSTLVAVQNISPSGSVMTADLIVGLASSVDDETEQLLPTTVELAQNYPNPFNPTTTIEFTVDQAAAAKLDVYNITGRHVATLLNGYVPSGTTRLTWDATTDSGHEVASGVYLYRLVAGEQQEVKKMILVR
jgi:immune inhibitor A